MWYDDDWVEYCKLFHTHHGLTFLDIGANIGTWTVPMSRCIKRFNNQSAVHVIAIEANPYHVALLRANLKRNLADNVLLYASAVSDSANGTIQLYMDSRNRGHTTAFLDTITDPASSKEVVAPVTTIDDIYH